MGFFKHNKKMIFIGIFTIAILTLVIVFFFNAGVLKDSTSTQLKYEVGNFDGTKYENKSIGISLFLAQDWHVNDKEMLLELADPNYHTLSDEEKSLYNADGIISTYDFAAYKNDGVTSFTVSVDKVSLLNKDKSKVLVKEYIELLKSGNTGRDVSKYTFDEKTSSITISDRKYTLVSAHFTDANTIKTYFIFASRGDYYVMMTLTFNDSQTEEINDFLDNNFK